MMHAGADAEIAVLRKLPAYWDDYQRRTLQGGVRSRRPAVVAKKLRRITEKLTTYPDGFTIHPKVKKLLEQRAEMGTGKRPWITAWPRRWPSARCWWKAFPCGFRGQDARRGTFNHRHSVLDRHGNENEYVPLCNIASRPGVLRSL